MGLTTCPKCGETISEKATVCPCCNSAVKQKQKKHKGVFKSIIVFTLIVVSVLGIGISQKAKELKYIIQIWKQYLLQCLMEPPKRKMPETLLKACGTMLFLKNEIVKQTNIL